MKLVAGVVVLLLILGLFCGCTTSNNNGEEEEKPSITIRGFRLDNLDNRIYNNTTYYTIANVSVRVVYSHIKEGYNIEITSHNLNSKITSVNYTDSDIKGTTGSTIRLTLDMTEFDLAELDENKKKIPIKFTVSVTYKGLEIDFKEYTEVSEGETVGDI